MNLKYQTPLLGQIMRPVIRSVLGGLLHILGNFTLTGRENVPAKGPYIIAYNHVSIFDPAVVGIFWPVSAEVLGAAEIWHRKGQAILATLWCAIPIQRGEIDRQALGKALAALRSGRPLMMAPEGGRSHTPGMRQAKSGVVYLIEATGAVIVPLGVVGTTDDFFTRGIHGKRPEFSMHIGRPFNLPEVNPDGLVPREIRQKKVDFIMEQIAALLPEEYRGVYGGKESLQK